MANLHPSNGKNNIFPFWAKGVVAQKRNMSAWESRDVKNSKNKVKTKVVEPKMLNLAVQSVL
jgi:hypothetical protein